MSENKASQNTFLPPTHAPTYTKPSTKSEEDEMDYYTNKSMEHAYGKDWKDIKILPYENRSTQEGKKNLQIIKSGSEEYISFKDEYEREEYDMCMKLANGC